MQPKINKWTEAFNKHFSKEDIPISVLIGQGNDSPGFNLRLLIPKAHSYSADYPVITCMCTCTRPMSTWNNSWLTTSAIRYSHHSILARSRSLSCLLNGSFHSYIIAWHHHLENIGPLRSVDESPNAGMFHHTLSKKPHLWMSPLISPDKFLSAGKLSSSLW